jgi:predicted acylesterase/phospholipase RssA
VRLRERFQITRPLEEMEVALVRGAIEQPRLVDAHEEAVLRTALSLARLYKVNQDGRDVGVGAWLEPFRQEIERRLSTVLLPPSGPIRRELLLPHLKELKARTLAVRAGLLERFEGRLSFEAVDRELRHKALVLVLGGGGGTAYPYMGAMALLDEYGLSPQLISATSMGAILGLFRSRMQRFEQAELVNIVRNLSWRRLFRVATGENRYGVPAALRLYLRAGLGRWFGIDARGGEGPQLKDLPIRTIVAVSGIRRGKLPHPLEFYEKLTQASPKSLLNPRVLPRWLSAIAELVSRPDVLVKVHLGQDAETGAFDALDAAGFSSAVPGVIHYDVLRDDPRMHQLISRVMEAHGVSRFIDGGLVDNLPAKAAWRAVHKGLLGTRNAFILGLNGFAPKLSQPLWLVLQQLAELNVKHARGWAHLTLDSKRTLSPLAVVPTVDQLLDGIEVGRRSLVPHLSLLSRMLAPLPRLADHPP